MVITKKGLGLLLASLCLGGTAAALEPPGRQVAGEVFRKSDYVFVGRVVDVKTRLGDLGNMVWTDYVFAVEDVWKGGLTECQHVVSIAGGRIGNLSVQVTHTPRFEKGERYVVASYDQSRLYHSAVVGEDRGLFREVKDEAGGTLLVDADGLRLERSPEGALVRGRPTRRIGREGSSVHVSTDEELLRSSEVKTRGWPDPLVLDAHGRPIPQRPAPSLRATVPEPEREAAGREDLRVLSRSVLVGKLSEVPR